MKPALPRRDFLKSTTVALTGLAACPAGAIEPFRRTGPPRLALSLAAYSFRDFFKTADGASGTTRRLDLFQFVDFCAEQGCAGTELTSYYFPKDLDDAFLLKLRRHAYLRGIEVSGTAVGNSFTDSAGDKRDTQIALVKKWVDHAAVLGAPHIRVFAGNQPRGMTLEEAKKNCISALEECGDHAGKRGIFLGIENHGGIVSEAAELIDIVRAVKSPWIGINLDSGNFHTEDPYRDLERIAPFAVNVQIKSEMTPRGHKKQPADLGRLVKILRDAGYQGYVALEYEAAEDPWQAVPVLLKKLGELLK